MEENPKHSQGTENVDIWNTINSSVRKKKDELKVIKIIQRKHKIIEWLTKLFIIVGHVKYKISFLGNLRKDGREEEKEGERKEDN